MPVKCILMPIVAPFQRMSSAGRRKRSAPKAAAAPTPIIADSASHAMLSATSLSIAVCREAAIAAAAARIPDVPRLTTATPTDVAEAVAVHLHVQLPTRIPCFKTVVRLPTIAYEALVQRLATVCLDAFACEWPRAVEEERMRQVAAAERHQREANEACHWNRRSRAVAVLGAPGMGYGFNVLPFLRRSLEGVAVHGTSVELRGACRRTKWRPEVSRHYKHVSCNRLCSCISLFVVYSCLVDLSCGVVCSPSRASLCGRSVRTVKISVSSGVCKD
jgi:hypothetical protein